MNIWNWLKGAWKSEKSSRALEVYNKEFYKRLGFARELTCFLQEETQVCVGGPDTSTFSAGSKRTIIAQPWGGDKLQTWSPKIIFL